MLASRDLMHTPLLGFMNGQMQRMSEPLEGSIGAKRCPAVAAG